MPEVMVELPLTTFELKKRIKKGKQHFGGFWHTFI